MILRAPAMRLIFLSGMLLSAAQICVSTFLVLFLTADYAFDPVTAGAVLAGVQGAGFCGRLLWGSLGDRLGSGTLCLLVLSLLLCVLTAVLALVDMSGRNLLLITVLLGVGLSASGWSGVLIVEIDRLAPKGHASEATATLMAGTFFGVVAGTAIFTSFASYLQHIGTAFALVSLSALLYLGRQPDQLTSIAEIARAYGVWQNHLMKVVSDLVSAGYVESVRGRGGGIRLGRSPSEINVGALVRHTEDDFDLVGCGSCTIAPACGLTSVLDEAMAAFMAVLERYTLADVLARRGDFSHLLLDFEQSASGAGGRA
jgi:Rrf2 family nitric oxide-sensitive transcriptional repressor